MPSVRSIQTVAVLGKARKTARTRLALLGFACLLPMVLIVMRVTDLAVFQYEGVAVVETPVSTPKETTAQNTKAVQFRADILDRNGDILATSLKTQSLYADPSFIEDASEAANLLYDLFPEWDRQELAQKMDRSGRFVWLKRGLTPLQAQQINDLGVPGLGFREESLKLTLDIRLQNAAHNAVVHAMDRFEAKAGTAIIMDVKEQSVLAAVSLPDYDPHQPAMADTNQRFNRFMQGTYELGSTFKLFSTAAFLDRVNNDLGYSFDASNPLTSGRFRISDYHAQNRTLTVPEVFMHSSNIGVALMAQEMGDDTLKERYQRYGFFDALPIKFSEKSDPIYPKIWRSVNSLTASFGHGLAVSPLHVAYAASALMNDGAAGGLKFTMPELRRAASLPEKRFVSPSVSHQLRGLMRLTVSEGTGRNADVVGYSVGGKTGSAEKPGVGGYDRDKLLSSFLGVYPMTDPRYLVYVIIDEPVGQEHSYGYATGGWVAAPAVARIIKDMNRIEMIPPVHSIQDAQLIQPLQKYLDDPGDIVKITQ